MNFKNINNWLHLWLGLGSGVIVLIVCLTGCIWVFNEEITLLTQPETNIPKQERAVLKPSQLISIANAQYPGMKVSYATYQQGRTINIGLGERKKGGVTLKVNPYTGEVVGKIEAQNGDFDFFRFILDGHRALWFPYEIGRPIVNYATLIFVILLITGLIWWWPKKWNKTTKDKSFKIKWGASFKRVNLDLHNVLGFYSLLLLLAIALTGMVYGIKWYSEGLYWVTTGGDSLPERGKLSSDSLQANLHYKPEQAIDLAFNKVINKHPKAEGFYYTFPDTAKAKSIISVSVYPDKGQFYNSRSYKFDQHTLKELTTSDVYDITFNEASTGQKLRKMNYDIHVGSILGFPGKVLAFLSTLIGASLPVTGFLIWWGRKFGKNRKARKSRNSVSETVQLRKSVKARRKLRQPDPILQRNSVSNKLNT